MSQVVDASWDVSGPPYSKKKRAGFVKFFGRMIKKHVQIIYICINICKMNVMHIHIHIYIYVYIYICICKK